MDRMNVHIKRSNHWKVDNPEYVRQREFPMERRLAS